MVSRITIDFYVGVVRDSNREPHMPAGYVS